MKMLAGMVAALALVGVTGADAQGVYPGEPYAYPGAPYPYPGAPYPYSGTLPGTLRSRASSLRRSLHPGALPRLSGREPLHGKMVHVRTERLALVLDTLAPAEPCGTQR